MIFDLFSKHMQLISAIVFFVLLAAWLWYERKKLDIQVAIGIPLGKQPDKPSKVQASPVMEYEKKAKSIPLLYFLLYRTKLGLKMMEDIAMSFPRFIKYLSYTGVYVGFAGMLLILASLAINVYKILFQDQKVGAAIVQPFVQTKEGSMFFYVPFFYFIIALFVIVVIHEMSHGIISRLFKVKLKSSGFAFMGIIIPIIPMAFVEPDEKMVKKLKPMQQLAIFAAGPFSNIILAVLIILLLNFAIAPFMAKITTTNVVIDNYTQGNITYPAQLAGVGIGERITTIDGVEIKDVKSFVEFMSKTIPGQKLEFTTNVSEYEVTLIAQAGKSSPGYLGVYVQEDYSYKQDFKKNFGILTIFISWFNGLLVWLVMLNIGIGLINLAPLGPIDGGRMLLTALMIKFPEEKAKLIWGKISVFTLLLLLANIFLPAILNLF